MSDVGRHNNSSSSYYQNLRLSHDIDVDLCTGQDTTPNSMKSTQERLQDTTNRAANSAGRYVAIDRKLEYQYLTFSIVGQGRVAPRPILSLQQTVSAMWPVKRKWFRLVS